MKKLLFLISAVFLGCGQYWEPDCVTRHIPCRNPEVFPDYEDSTVYDTLPHSALLDILVNTLDQDPEAEGSPVDDPLNYPISYLDANAAAFGEPNYELDIPPSEITSLGFKTWLLVSSSACGELGVRNLNNPIFVNGVLDYDHLYTQLLLRLPTEQEVAILDGLREQFIDEGDQKAAVCTAIVNSLEFLNAN